MDRSVWAIAAHRSSSGRTHFVRCKLPLLGQLDHANGRFVATRAAGPASERRFVTAAQRRPDLGIGDIMRRQMRQPRRNGEHAGTNRSQHVRPFRLNSGLDQFAAQLGGFDLGKAATAASLRVR